MDWKATLLWVVLIIVVLITVKVVNWDSLSKPGADGKATDLMHFEQGAVRKGSGPPPTSTQSKDPETPIPGEDGGSGGGGKSPFIPPKGPSPHIPGG